MHVTPAELDALQRLPDRSRALATSHLRGIINDRRALPAADIIPLLTGMKVVAADTVPARGESCLSAADGPILAADADHTGLGEDPARWISATDLPDPRP